MPLLVVPVVVGTAGPGLDVTGLGAEVRQIVTTGVDFDAFRLEGSPDGATQWEPVPEPAPIFAANASRSFNDNSNFYRAVRVIGTAPLLATLTASTGPGGPTVVTGTVTANQGTAAAVASAWPIEVTDGTNVAAVKAASTAPVYTDRALVVAQSPNGPSVVTAMASTNGSVGTGTAAATVTSIAYLFHPNTVAKDIQILRIDVTFSCGAGNASANVTARGAFITAENAVPGGTSQTINPTNRADTPVAGMVFRSGANAPTRVAGDLLSLSYEPGVGGTYSWIPNSIAQPIVLRSGTNEGFEIRTVVESALTTAQRVAVTYYWREK